MSLTLRVLGTATPYPVPGNTCSGYLIQTARTRLLVELGLAVWPRLQRYTDPSCLDAIWISHLHPDHSGDLLALYQWAANTADAPRPRVFGPPGWAERVGGVLPADDGPQQLRRLFDVTEHTDTSEARVGDLTLTALPVTHSVPTWGYASPTTATSSRTPRTRPPVPRSSDSPRTRTCSCARRAADPG